MAGISNELLQSDCMSPLTQAQRQVDMSLVTIAKKKKKTANFFMVLRLNW